jgi:hypothetical protein
LINVPAITCACTNQSNGLAPPRKTMAVKVEAINLATSRDDMKFAHDIYSHKMQITPKKSKRNLPKWDESNIFYP